MDELESQTLPLPIGPSQTVIDIELVKKLCGKKNRINLSRIYEKIHANPEQYNKKGMHGKEMQSFISGIVQLIENWQDVTESTEIMKICIFLSNLILCVDAEYREDFINSSQNIFEVLGRYFSSMSLSIPSKTSLSSSEEFQTLVFIYKLLMATRQSSEVDDSSKNTKTRSKLGCCQMNLGNVSIIEMRERLLSKEFMRRILEIDAEEWSDSASRTREMWRMLIAFYSLFMRSRSKLVSYSLSRLLKERLLDGIDSLTEDLTSLHQVIACLNCSLLDTVKLTAKEVTKHNLVNVLCNLLDNPRTSSQQIILLLRVLSILGRQNLLQHNHLTLTLGKAFKMFSRAPQPAAELIAIIHLQDPTALKDITLHFISNLLSGLTKKWSQSVALRRSSEQELLSYMNIQTIQVKQSILETESQIKNLVELITKILNKEVALALVQSGDIDLIVFPLLNSIEIVSSSLFSLVQTDSHSSDSHSQKIEEDSEHKSDDSEHSENKNDSNAPNEIDFMMSCPAQNLPMMNDVSNGNFSELKINGCNPKLCESIVNFIQRLLLIEIASEDKSTPNAASSPISFTKFNANHPNSNNNSNLTAQILQNLTTPVSKATLVATSDLFGTVSTTLVNSPEAPLQLPQLSKQQSFPSSSSSSSVSNNYQSNLIDHQSRNQYLNIMLSKLTSLHLPTLLRALLSDLQTKYLNLQSGRGGLTHLDVLKLRQFIPLTRSASTVLLLLQRI